MTRDLAAPHTVEEEGAIRPLLRAARAHRLLILLTTLAALGGAIVFLSVREPTYEASATVLVNPLPQSDQTFLGLGLLRDSGDATRTVQTAATLLESTAAAQRTAEALGDDWTQERVLADIDIEPQGESNIIAVTATTNDAALSAQLADAFTKAALDVRARALRRDAAAAIERTQAELDRALPGTGNSANLSASITQLRSVIASGDPTLTFEQPATLPSSPSGAGPLLVIPLALVAGLALGFGGALLWELLDRRIHDTETAFAIYPLPILARVPVLADRKKRAPPGAIWFMPPEVREPFRSLTVQLRQRKRPQSVILVTSATRGDGKTTSAVDLAVSFAAAGEGVVLLDLDLRNPQVALALGTVQAIAPSELLDPEVQLDELLVRPSESWTLQALALRPAPGEPDPSEHVIQRLPALVEQARPLADFVVVDTPPLGEVSDALWLARDADDILVVVRVGNTIRSHLQVMRQLLERNGQTPDGCIVVDPTERSARGYYSDGIGGLSGLVMDDKRVVAE